MEEKEIEELRTIFYGRFLFVPKKYLVFIFDWFIAKMAESLERKINTIKREIFEIERAPEDYSLEYKTGYGHMRSLATSVSSLQLPNKESNEY